MPDAYATVDNIRNIKSITKEDGRHSDDALELALELASEMIDLYTSRDFRAQVSTAKKIKLTNSSRLNNFIYIDDFHEITSVLVDGEQVDYTPIKDVNLSWWPYQYIELDNVLYSAKEITINGTPGWAAVPTGIMKACVELAATFDNNSIRSYQAGQQNKGQRKELRISQMSQQMLDELLRMFVKHSVVDLDAPPQTGYGYYYGL